MSEHEESQSNPEEENQDTPKAVETGSDNETIIPEEILEHIPIEDRGKVVSVIKESMFAGITRRSNPISEKITESHITSLISNSDSRDVRDRKDNKTQKTYNVILVFLALLFVGFLVVYLQNNSTLLITIITAILSFIGGFGFGKSHQSKD